MEIEGKCIVGGWATLSSHVLSLSASIVASDHGPIPATPSASAKPAASMGFDGMGVR